MARQSLLSSPRCWSRSSSATGPGTGRCRSGHCPCAAAAPAVAAAGGGRVPGGAGADADAASPDAGHGRGGDTAAAGHTRRLTVRGIAAAARCRATWRQLGYHLVAGPALAAARHRRVGVWLAGVLYTLVYAYAWALPTAEPALARPVAGRPGQPPAGDAGHPGGRVPDRRRDRAAGVAPWLTGAVAALDARPPGRCWDRAAPRNWSTRWGVWPRPGPARWTRPTPSGAAWSGTCTTAPSSGSCPWR